MSASSAPIDTDVLSASLAGHRFAPQRDGAPPSAAQLDELARAALGAPDHGLLHPFRLVAVGANARERLAEAIATDLLASGMGSDEATGRGRGKAFAAPCLLAVIASPRSAKVPVWEQVAAAASAGYAAVLRAQVGLGSVWKSPAQRDGAAIRAFFELTDEEELLGWVLLGTPEATQRPSKRADLEPSAVLRSVSA